MRTVRNSSRLLSGGGSPHTPPRSRPPKAGTPPGADPPKAVTLPREQAPPWRPAARHAGIPPTMHAGIAPPRSRHPLRDLLQGMLRYHLQCMLGQHPSPVNRITDTCKNITFATSLRSVKTQAWGLVQLMWFWQWWRCREKYLNSMWSQTCATIFLQDHWYRIISLGWQYNAIFSKFFATNKQESIPIGRVPPRFAGHH